MTSPEPSGIRAAPPKTYWLVPYDGKQYDPPSAPQGPRHTYFHAIRSRQRPHVDTKYDVRATYPPSHPLRTQPPKPAPLPPLPSIDDYFSQAKIPADDGYLRPLWEEEAVKRGGWEAETLQGAPVPSGGRVSPAGVLLVLMVFGVLSLPSIFSCVVSTYGDAASWVGGAYEYLWYALLFAAYKFFPLTLWMRDGVLRVSVCTGRCRRSRVFWFCVVVGVLVCDWGVRCWGERAPGVVVGR